MSARLHTIRHDTALEDFYCGRTAASASLMERAMGCMPGGNTRTFGHTDPYPVVFREGSGVLLRDLDGNEYLDLMFNGMSLIHGHAFPPIQRAIAAALPHGTAWPGASELQVAFAELLVSRVPGGGQVRFTNSGTEATMLAVKLARHVTDRPLILKARGAYHGSYSDLEAGLYGVGDIPRRAVVAEFGSVESFADALAAHPGKVAGVILEPILVTNGMVPPPAGFLAEVGQLAREAGALVILDDCITFRIAPGGTAEKHRVAADITCLGKWMGGGLPLGAIVADAELLGVFDPRQPDAVYHGGSFNGNPLSCAAGAAALEHLGAAEIARMDHQAATLKERVADHAAELGVQIAISGEGPLFAISVDDDRRSAEENRKRRATFSLAALNHGVYLGPGGEGGMATPYTDELVAEAATRIGAALAHLAVHEDQS